jgi:hypothetical protein
MRRILVLAVSVASLGSLLPTAVSAGGYGRGCCAPGPVVTYPGPTYTYGGPYYFNSNLYYYRGYYPYPMPRDVWTSRRR